LFIEAQKSLLNFGLAIYELQRQDMLALCIPISLVDCEKGCENGKFLPALNFKGKASP
jgi:hypothetical protein